MQQKPSRSISMAGTVAYGLFIIVPLGIVFWLLVKLTGILEKFAAPLGLESAFGALIAFIIASTAALALVVLFSWVIGSLVRRVITYDKFEGAILNNIPGYQIVANITKGFSEGKTAYPPVLLKIHGQGISTYGFIMAEHDNGSLTVFVPLTPVLTVGNLYVVAPDRVTRLTAGSSEIADCISQWGVGAKQVVADSGLDTAPEE